LTVKAPFLKYKQIQSIVSKFSKRYNPDNVIPVPVEEILDNSLKINIISVPSLRDNGVDAHLSCDLTDIYVDEYIYCKQYRRYRFILAHELAHIILHSDIFKSAVFHNHEEYLSFVNSIDQEQHTWLEQQANAFAGLLLVPPKPLEEKFSQCIAILKAEKQKISLSDPLTKEYMAGWISEYFEVSAMTIAIRLERDKLVPSKY